MSSNPIVFRYSEYKGITIPLIPIKLMDSDNQWHEFWVYVDSGATYSILKAQEAKRLGIDLEAGKLEGISVGDGSSIPVYFHKLTFKLGDHEFKARIGFSHKLGIGFNVLGRKDIFDRFVVCFDDQKKQLILHPNKNI